MSKIIYNKETNINSTLAPKGPSRDTLKGGGGGVDPCTFSILVLKRKSKQNYGGPIF